LEEISASRPYQNNPGTAHALAEVDHNLANLLIKVARRAASQRHDDSSSLGVGARHLESARICYPKAVEIHGTLTRWYPLVPKYRRQQARHYLARGTLLANHLQLRREGLADFQRALEVFQTTIDFPSPFVH
jgi:hypothetical protein